jgi:hypothetical protein
VLLAREADGRAISFFGDLHPSFFGNVVKAMGSAKRGYPVVSRMLDGVRRRPRSTMQLLAQLDDGLRATVHEVDPPHAEHRRGRVHAPFAARALRARPVLSPAELRDARAVVDGTRLAMEGLALTGAWVDRERGLVSTIVLEMGGSSDLCAIAEARRTRDPDGSDRRADRDRSGETVVLVGGGLGNAVLFSIGQAMRRAPVRRCSTSPATRR